MIALILFFIVLDAVIAWDVARRLRQKPLVQTKADAYRILFQK